MWKEGKQTASQDSWKYKLLPRQRSYVYMYVCAQGALRPEKSLPAACTRFILNLQTNSSLHAQLHSVFKQGANTVDLHRMTTAFHCTPATCMRFRNLVCNVNWAPASSLHNGGLGSSNPFLNSRSSNEHSLKAAVSCHMEWWLVVSSFLHCRSPPPEARRWL